MRQNRLLLDEPNAVTQIEEQQTADDHSRAINQTVCVPLFRATVLLAGDIESQSKLWIVAIGVIHFRGLLMENNRKTNTSQLRRPSWCRLDINLDYRARHSHESPELELRGGRKWKQKITSAACAALKSKRNGKLNALARWRDRPVLVANATDKNILFGSRTIRVSCPVTWPFFSGSRWLPSSTSPEQTFRLFFRPAEHSRRIDNLRRSHN